MLSGYIVVSENFPGQSAYITHGGLVCLLRSITVITSTFMKNAVSKIEWKKIILGFFLNLVYLYFNKKFTNIFPWIFFNLKNIFLTNPG